jgi:regulator of protease activity HflC (stomatin/prohibitin superfamily)
MPKEDHVFEQIGVLFPAIIALGVLLFGIISAAVKVVQEYERGVIFRLGRLVGAKGPGLFLIIPIIDRMVRVDLRTVTLDIPSQDVITRDNVTVRVNAVAYFRVVDPEAAVVRVENFLLATNLIAQTTMRSVLGQSELDELLSKREEINQLLQKIIDEQTEPWGVKVSVVEVRDVELPQTMQRAMARQAEAERDKRARIISADGEYQAAQRLADAAAIINAAPSALQIRYLQALGDISSDSTRTIIFPLPMDLISAFLGRGSGSGEGTGLDSIQPVVPTRGPVPGATQSRLGPQPPAPDVPGTIDEDVEPPERPLG